MDGCMSASSPAVSCTVACFCSCCQPVLSAATTHWVQVGGALCILLEIGEKDIVLQAGQSVLYDESSSSISSDVKLAMALAYVELSQETMAQSPPATVPSCGHLDAALKLLQVRPL